ncbi:hypothetical protein CHGG_07879 [Chaetomium globosum CBS 148.51]|uniref:Small ribosomal subunit protein uS5m n=1 Tax=Chaetomium globosum (strain ATCC 6205 / CBS 148.51 / DSM 1962 / NBRC 6347 / NRRL 1970) TaxID=306901 RepID=Q2GVX5_CHAGB|nr:uncharacterized protein CHGG_07879 [Chaetomium globosum CBS 148.51]EAQ86626.1 hypothetical protein CHGG_07879 [Chaetomium globosum CBS 148.51]
MSVARPAARRLLSGRLAAGSGAASCAAAPATTTCHQLGFAHQFHSSPQLSARRKPRFANVRAADMGLMDEKQIDQFTKEQFPKYTQEEIDHLRTKYSPAQIAALEAGEAAIDPRDLTVQGRLRVDPYTMPYIDDFAETQPIIDKRAKNQEAPDPLARFMNMDEFTADLVEWADKFQEGDVTGKLKTPADFVSDEFKKKPEGQWPGEVREAAHKAFQNHGLDDIGIYQDLKRRTGLRVKDILNLHSKQLVQRRVANQTRLGKVQKASIMYVVGNGNGWLGIGEAKSTEPSIAGLKARLLAIRNMRPIRRYEDRTIYGSVTAKVSGTVVKMNARPPGFGLRVSHRIFEMCRAAGIQDLAANIPRSRNPMNTVKAAYWALCNQPDPERMAIGRGKKMVDVRKVYYGGATL